MKTHLTKILVLSSFLIASAYGQSTELMPLTVGNEWVYIDSSFSSTTAVATDTIFHRISDETDITIDEQTYPVRLLTFPNDTTLSRMNFRKPLKNDPDGLWEFGAMTTYDTLTYRHLFLKYPTAAGDTSTMLIILLGDYNRVVDTVTVKTISIDSVFHTPAGSFECIVYQHENIDFSGDMMKPGIWAGNRFMNPIADIQSVNHSNHQHTYFYKPGLGFVGYIWKINNQTVQKTVLLSSNIPLSISSHPENVLREVDLYQNYPNPFNPSTTFRFYLPKTADVIVHVLNIRGQVVAEVLKERLSAGEHSKVFDASGLSSGIYFYRLSAGQFSETRKMVVVR